MPNSPFRRGFRLPGNTLVLLFIFFLIGLFLHYGGQTRPVVAFWNDVRRLVGLGPNRASNNKDAANPYKAPEPTNNPAREDVATDDRSGQNTAPETASDEATATGRNNSSPATESRNNPTGAPSANDMPGSRFDFEKQIDFLLPASKPNNQAQLVRHEGYTLEYRTDYKSPEWVAYPLLAYEITGDADRDGTSFKPDPTVDGGTALPSDYTRSGYDRGHLAPAGDFKFSQQMMTETFFMSNITPQAPQFNRGIWKALEEQVRAWAFRDGGLYVVTGPVLRPGLETIGHQNEVAVSEYCYKVLLYCRKPNIRMIGFLLKNEPSHQSLQAFVVPVDKIEAMTGLDFFPKIPDDLERTLESKTPAAMIQQWFGF
jgi:endonuclease G, mitochondrial